jgi:hypothetical protein
MSTTLRKEDQELPDYRNTLTQQIGDRDNDGLCRLFDVRDFERGGGKKAESSQDQGIERLHQRMKSS